MTNEELLISQIKDPYRVKPIKIPYDPKKIFFTSDLHFNHKNIMNFCKRPFKDIDEMKDILIANWNNVVGKDCIVFDLGDFAFAGTGEWKRILKELNGIHILIKGNHEVTRAPQPSALRDFFAVYENLTIEINGQKIYLNHFPYLCMDGTYKTEHQPWQLFGHVHLSPIMENNIGKDFDRLKILFPNQYDVGVDFNNYEPISFEEVKEKIDYQIQNNVNCLTWIKW